MLCLLAGAAIAAPAIKAPTPPSGAAPVRPAAGRPAARVPVTRVPLPPQADPASVAKAETLVAKGMALYDDGAFGQAIQTLDSACKLDPRNARGLYYLANAYWRLDDYGHSTAAFTRLLALDPRGPFADDARDWLAAQGSFDILAARVKVRSGPAGTPPHERARVLATMQDGWTKIEVPAGWTKAGDEVVKDPVEGEFYRLALRKDLGGGQAATLMAEAHHHNATPPPGKSKKAVPGLTDITDRMLSELGISEYQITRSRAVASGQEQEFEAPKAPGGPAQGSIHGVWDGTSLLVTVALAPKAAWAGVAKQVQPAAASLKTATASERQAGALSGLTGPAPTPTPRPTPNVPTFYMPRPGEPTLPPALYPAPWGTPLPTPSATRTP